MEKNLKKDLVSFLAESIYEGSDPEYILGEFYDVFVEAFDFVKAWRKKEENEK